MNADQLRVASRRREVLGPLTFSMVPGSVALIHGPSGVGKTVLCYALGGCLDVYAPDLQVGGSLELEGRSLVAGDRTIATALMTESPQASLSGLADTAEQELALALEARGVGACEIRRRIRDALAKADATHLAHRGLYSLSGGELQRVALASILVLHAQIIVLDNPLTNLDHRGREIVLNCVRSESRRGAMVAIAERPTTELRTLAGIEMELGERESTDWPPPSALALYKPDGADVDSLSSGSLLEIDEVSFRYDQSRDIFARLSFSAERASALVIRGDNGSGKSTLLRLILGVLTPQHGAVRVAGRTVASMRRRDRARYIAYCAQDAQTQICRATTTAEVELGLREKTADGLARRAAAREWLTAFHIPDDTHPYDLRRSLRRRLVLASVLARRAPITLVDEPTQLQDAMGRMIVLEALVRRVREGGLVVCVTHDSDFADDLCGRVPVRDLHLT